MHGWVGDWNGPGSTPPHVFLRLQRSLYQASSSGGRKASRRLSGRRHRRQRLLPGSRGDRIAVTVPAGGNLVGSLVVVEGGPVHLLLPLADVGGVLVRHLALHADVVGDETGGVAEGGDEELVPEGGSVDAVVQEADRHVGPALDGSADLLDCLGIGLWTLQEAAVASQDLVQGVPLEVEEALRGVHDGIVGKAGIRNDEVLLGGLEGLDEGEVPGYWSLFAQSLAKSAAVHR